MHYIDGVSGESFTDRVIHGDPDCSELGDRTRPLADSTVERLDDAELCSCASETCEVEKADGEVCGRERPCPYHD